ncbi:MAG: hypothetical protein GC154_19330 [bacterium]|nr:hypothetical protein [bacterium]
MSSTIPVFSEEQSRSADLTLETIYSPILPELEKTRALYEETILATAERNLLEKLVCGDGHFYIPEAFRVSVVNQISSHLLQGEGKWVRAAMVLLSADAFGTRSESVHQVAVAVELIHLATLVHDDIIDEAPVRRGVKTVSHNWGNSIAVLLGDFLFSKAFKLLLSSKSIPAQTMLTQATGQMCLGEIRELEYSYRNGISEADYMEMIACKTASLMAAATASGADIAGLDEDGLAAMHAYGHNVGMAFQIVDDVLDYTSNVAALGKEQGVDIRNEKATLPLIRLFEAKGDEAETILNSDISIEEKREALLSLMNAAGAIEAAYASGKRYGDAAREQLALLQSQVQNTESWQSLHSLIDFVLKRER